MIKRRGNHSSMNHCTSTRRFSSASVPTGSSQPRPTEWRGVSLAEGVTGPSRRFPWMVEKRFGHPYRQPMVVIRKRIPLVIALHSERHVDEPLQSR